MDASKLVFLDECSVNTGMTRLYARAASNERVVDYTPDVRFERTSLLSSVRLSGETVPLVFRGSLNGEFFKEYISVFLVPTLNKGDIVIMDNLTAHKVQGVTELIEAAGASVLYLPLYSPDLNPVELMWSKVKAYLRKVRATTYDALVTSIANAIDLVVHSDIMGWFNQNGYSTQ